MADGESLRYLFAPTRGLKQAQRTEPDMREFGLPGTKILAGQVFEDPNPDLVGQRGLRMFLNMSLDPTIAAMLRAYSMPIRSTRWFVEPASDDPKAVEMADFIHYVMWDFGTQSFDDVIRSALQMLTYGFSWAEVVYNRIVDGKFKGKIGWDKIRYRTPMSKWRWNVEEADTAGGGRTRQLVSVTQLAPPSYVETIIPRDKLLLWIHDIVGENYDGISMLRPAYKPWFYKDMLLKIQAIGLERGYMGIPDATVPEDFSAKEVQAARQIVENLRTHEAAGVVRPQHIGLNLLTNKLEGQTMQQAITYHDHQILVSALAQFLVLGQHNVGSFALSEDQSDLFLMALNGVANYISEVFNLDPGIPKLIGYNYPNVADDMLPRLVHGDVGQRSLDKLGRTLMALATGGFLTPDDETEDRLREYLQLPARDSKLEADALRELIPAIAPDNPTRINHTPRAPIVPPGAAQGQPGASLVGRQSGASGAVASSTNLNPPKRGGRPGQPGGGDAAAMSESEWNFLFSQLPWQRPKGRLTEGDRHRIRNSELLLDFFESSRPFAKPDMPSVRMAKKRRPYPLLSEDEVQRRIQSMRAAAPRFRGAERKGKASKMLVGKVAKQGETEVRKVLQGLRKG